MFSFSISCNAIISAPFPWYEIIFLTKLANFASLVSSFQSRYKHSILQALTLILWHEFICSNDSLLFNGRKALSSLPSSSRVSKRFWALRFIILKESEWRFGINKIRNRNNWSLNIIYKSFIFSLRSKGKSSSILLLVR